MRNFRLNHRLPRRAAVLAAAFCSSGEVGAGGNAASAPGVTATTITLGSNQPLTGPAAPGYGEIGPAINSVFQYINAHGGVYGRKFDFNYKDDA